MTEPNTNKNQIKSKKRAAGFAKWQPTGLCPVPTNRVFVFLLFIKETGGASTLSHVKICLDFGVQYNYKEKLVNNNLMKNQQLDLFDKQALHTTKAIHSAGKV